MGAVSTPESSRWALPGSNQWPLPGDSGSAQSADRREPAVGLHTKGSRAQSCPSPYLVSRWGVGFLRGSRVSRSGHTLRLGHGATLRRRDSDPFPGHDFCKIRSNYRCSPPTRRDTLRPGPPARPGPSNGDESPVAHHQRRALAQEPRGEARTEHLMIRERRAALRTLERPGRHDRRRCLPRRGRLRPVTVAAALLTPAHGCVFDTPQFHAVDGRHRSRTDDSCRVNAAPLPPVITGCHRSSLVVMWSRRGRDTPLGITLRTVPTRAAPAARSEQAGAGSIATRYCCPTRRRRWFPPSSRPGARFHRD